MGMDYLLDDNALVDVCQTLRRANPTLIATGAAATNETDIFGHSAVLRPVAHRGSSGSVKRSGGSSGSLAGTARSARTNLSRALEEQHEAYLRAIVESHQSLPLNAAGARKKSRKDVPSASTSKPAVVDVTDARASVATTAAKDSVVWAIFSRRMEMEQRLSLATYSSTELEAPRVPSFYAMTGSSSEAVSAGCPSNKGNHLCSVCLLPAPYRCDRCRTALFCSVRCSDIHDGTRCQKFLA